MDAAWRAWATEEARLREAGAPEATGAASWHPRPEGEGWFAYLERWERELTRPPESVPAPGAPGRLAFRRVVDAEPLEEVTGLLNRAYGSMAVRNVRFVATWQGLDITASRFAKGEGWLAFLGDRLAATVTVHPPGTDDGDDFFGRPGVSKFTQLAVEPELKGQGFGSELMDFVERWAIERGASEVALDTAVPATDLRAMYRARGYRHIGYCDYRPDTNYLSVVMSKRLA